MHRLKPTLQLLLRPLARWAAGRGTTANQVTLLAMAGSLVIGALLAFLGPSTPLVWASMPLWMALRMALNALDGMLARTFRQKTLAGAYANELADVVSDAALILPLVTLPGFRTDLVVLMALLASWTEMAGVMGPTVGASRRHEGPMGKADRALVLGVIGGWTALFGAVPSVLFVQVAMLVLLAATIGRRVYAGLGEAGGLRR